MQSDMPYWSSCFRYMCELMYSVHMMFDTEYLINCCFCSKEPIFQHYCTIHTINYAFKRFETACLINHF